MASDTERPLRRDAERNRQRILEAARVAFAERGLQVSLDEIARQAGVGVGTVYRRFPDKEKLIDALFRDRLDEMVAIGEEALGYDDGWAGLVFFLERAIEHQSADRGLRELMLSPSHGRDRVALGRERMLPLVAQIVERARASGALRDDADATDFLLVQIAIGAIVDAASDVAPELWRRMFTLTLDGLRASRPGYTPLPAEALDLDGVEQVMQRWRPPARR